MTVVDVTVPADAFLLGDVLETHPETRVRFEQTIPVGADVSPSLRLTRGDVAAAVESLRGSAHVECATESWPENTAALVAVDWADAARNHPVVAGIRDVDGALVSATGTGRGWRLTLRFFDRESLSTWYRRCEDAGVPLTIERISETGRRSGAESALTSTQRATLAAARDAGYFDIPRRVTLQDLAADLGVSDQSVSERLRRGLATLAEQRLAE